MYIVLKAHPSTFKLGLNFGLWFGNVCVINIIVRKVKQNRFCQIIRVWSIQEKKKKIFLGSIQQNS